DRQRGSGRSAFFVQFRWRGALCDRYACQQLAGGTPFSLADARVQSARAIRTVASRWKMEAYAGNDSPARFRIAGNNQPDAERFRRTLRRPAVFRPTRGGELARAISSGVR